MRKSYHVTLTHEEIAHLNELLNKGKHTAQKRKRAQALLHAHQGWSDRQIVDAVGMRRSSVEGLRQRFVEDGFETVLNGKPKRSRSPVLDGRAEAHLVAVVCSSAKPEGRNRWTIRLLRDRLVADLELESLSHETVRQTLKKTNLSLGSTKNSASPRKATPISPPTWRTSSMSMNARRIHGGR
jgi:transposase